MLLPHDYLFKTLLYNDQSNNIININMLDSFRKLIYTLSHKLHKELFFYIIKIMHIIIYMMIMIILIIIIILIKNQYK